MLVMKITVNKKMMIAAFIFLSVHIAASADQSTELMSENISAVRAWWLQCDGDKPSSTCLTDSELAQFKKLCSDRDNKEDCKKVVNFSVAKTRIPEARYLLSKGFAAQVSNFKAFKEYKNEIEKIWSAEDKSNSANSFAVGLLPSCGSKQDNKLYFSSQLRPAVKKLKNEIVKVYENLASIPCPSSKTGFTLVAIGKIHDGSDEFEIYTIDENKTIKSLRTALPEDPFQPNHSSNKLVSQIPAK